MYQLDLGDVTKQLYENNARFLQRMLQTGLDQQQRWGQAMPALFDGSEAPVIADSGRFPGAVDWPAAMAWRAIRSQLLFLRGAIEVAIASQTAQRAALQEAVTDWQTERLRILTGGARKFTRTTSKAEQVCMTAAPANGREARAMKRSARP